MKRINDAVLRPGDIILTTSTAKVSKGIRFTTGSDISHAMVCVEGYSVIDATAEGVQARNTQRLFYKDGHPVHICGYRMIFPKRDSMRFSCLCAGKGSERHRFSEPCGKRRSTLMSRSVAASSVTLYHPLPGSP